jgi:hypothetical protein
MKRLTPTQLEYLKAAELFLWAEAQDFTCWLTGQWKPWKRTQYNLPRMVKKGALTAVRHGKKLVYSVGKKRANNKADIEHGLICTKSLLRFNMARNGEFISEKFFRTINLGSVPEWGVIYDGKILLFEYSTADNFRRTMLMKKKVAQYIESIPRFKSYFGKEVVVLFVFAGERYKVKYFCEKYGQHPKFYFCDLASFFDVELGGQLSTPIYYWKDGRSYPLV